MLAVLSGYRGSTEATFSRSVQATQSVSFPPALASIADSGSNIALRPRQEARGKRQKFTTEGFQLVSMS
ncbi:hypothetical protein [Moorena producens]|uniref:hypothetical protein n=1 Tax=Moorena producens TaxID=1155739 RepID=UPI003C755A20